jgi:hypothetical protein
MVCLGLLNEGDQIASQFGAQKIHRRGREFREQIGLFLTHFDCSEIHGYCVSRSFRTSSAVSAETLAPKRAVT